MKKQMMIAVALACVSTFWWLRTHTSWRPEGDVRGTTNRPIDKLQSIPDPEIVDRGHSIGSSSSLRTQAISGVAPTAFGATSNRSMTPTIAAGKVTSERLRGWVDGKNVVIAFWGKVVDQDDIGIGDVEVSGTIREWGVFGLDVDAKFHDFVTKSDPSGLFNLGGRKGDSIFIKAIRKPGYELKPLQEVGFSYSGPGVHKPDVDLPVVFKMWKKRGAMPLYVYDITTAGVVNGPALELNLTDYHRRGESKEASDLRITGSRGGVSTNGLKHRYDWAATIEAVAGGLQVAADEFANLAPMGGYSNRVVIVSNSSEAGWSREKHVRLYFRTRGDRQYGFVDLAINVGETYPQFRVIAKSRVNPSGSPVLEREQSLDLNKDSWQYKF